MALVWDEDFGWLDDAPIPDDAGSDMPESVIDEALEDEEDLEPGVKYLRVGELLVPYRTRRRPIVE